jgi:hypothetical protein
MEAVPGCKRVAGRMLGHLEWERAVTLEDREELLRGVCERTGADGPSMGA